MGNVRLTLKDLTPAQHEELNAAIEAECKKHGVAYVFDLPDLARQKVTRVTMDRFEAQNKADALARERDRTKATRVNPEDIKTFTWGTNRRR